MKLKSIVLAGLSACLLLTAGCGGAPKQDSTEGLQPFEVVLDWYPNAIHAFLYQAIEKGYYAEEGLDVKLRFPTNDNDALSLVAAGKADVGMYYPTYLVEARAEQNVPIQSIGAICQQPLNVVLSLKEKNINSPKDFVGKNIGYGGSPTMEALVATMMKHEGVDPSSVTMTNVGMDLMSAMTTDQVDLTVGCMLNHEVPQLEQEGFAVNYFNLFDYGVPKDYELVFVANDKKIQTDAESLRAFLRASKRGFADMKNDPEGSLKLLLDKQNAENFPLTESVEAQSMRILLPVMELDGVPFLTQDAAVWQRDIDWMLEQGMIQNPISVQDIMTDLGV